MSAPRIVNVQEAKTNLSKLLRAVESGEDIAIARGGRVIARLVRFEPESPRRWRIFEGQVVMADDAFAPVEEAGAWEGSVEP